MSKIICLTVALLFITATVFAAPPTNFGQGKTSIDIGIAKPEVTTSAATYPKKNNFDFGVTTGLGNDFAVQYKYQKIDTGNLGPMNLSRECQEINLLYKLDKNLNAFIGLNRLSGSLGVNGSDYDMKDVNRYQIGLTGVLPLAEKLNGWATVAAGNKNNSYEIGVAYAMSSVTEFNLFYRYKKFTDLEINSISYNFDAKSSGVGVGLTFMF